MRRTHAIPLPRRTRATGRDGPSRRLPPEPAYPPNWLALLLLLAFVGLGTLIIRNVTGALTAMLAGPRSATVTELWPRR